MDQFKKQQPPTPEAQIEKPEEPGAEREQQRQTIARSVAGDKRSIDSTIEFKARTVQQIFSVLERRTVERTGAPNERAVENPEEVMDKIKADISQLGHPTVDDISRVLTTSGLGVRDIESWLAANKSEVQSLLSEKKGLEIRSSQLSARLAEEKWKNLLTKLFHKKEGQTISAQLKETSNRIAQINALLRKRQSRGNQIEMGLRELSARQQKLALNALEQLFQGVTEGYKQLKEKLTSPAVKQELNEGLIARRILPELDKLQTEGKITREDAEEYVGLLKGLLAEGDYPSWNDPIEKKEAIYTRIKRLDKLNQKSQNSLADISYHISVYLWRISPIHRSYMKSNYVADINYDKIFDFLLREVAKEQIEQLRDSLGGSLSPELQAKVAKIAEGVIYPHSEWEFPKEQGREILDLSKLPINDFGQLEGLERWPMVKGFAGLSDVIPKEVFARVEKIIIQRSFNEQLFPGGCESESGTKAAKRMGGLGNPEALPLMLRHIEVFGPGRTSNDVVFAMERLLKESNSAELQQVLESLPRSKRILLETLADENSYRKRFEGFSPSYHTCYLLQNGDLMVARERLTKILDNSGDLDEEKLRDFYLERTKDTPETLELLLRARPRVEKMIIDSKLGIWTQLAGKLLAALVNPRNGESVAFPKRIAQEGLGISDEKMLAVLDKIFETKTFKESGFGREAFLDGLVLLNSKENGKAVLETLLAAYRGTRNDPARMRRVLQFLSVLDGFSEYNFVAPDQTKIEGINQEIANLQNQYSQSQDKTERKKIKNRIETLNSDLWNLTGLKGIEDTMTQKVVEVACKQLELPQEYRDKIENNLEELLKSGIFEIVPSLASKYEKKKETEVKNLLRTITTHIIEGDFISWRYAHERSEAQLAGLTKKQKEFWRETLEPVTIDIELPEDEKDRRASELKVVQEIIRNAKEHILDSQPNFDFSKERVRVLAIKISELTERIKFATSEDEKKRLALEKRVVQAEATLINGISGIENATPQSFTREKILTQAGELRERITELNIPLAGLDIEQIEKVFTVGNIKSVTAYESDDALTLLKVGIEPRETCQSWRRGEFNECLLAYVADSNKKVLNVADDKGRIIARSIIKLTNQRNEKNFESKTQRKTLFVEELYSLLPNSEVYRVFMRVLLTKARGLDASITFGKGFGRATLQIFEEEARAVGYEMSKGGLEVFIPHSLNKYEYSDTLGGKISSFGRYKQLEAVTFEKSEV